MPTRINDPFTNFNFLVETGGVLAAGFSEVTGMNAEIQAVEYREGKDPNSNTRKLPGLAKYGNVTLKRGVVIDQDFFKWFKTGVDGAVLRLDISILLLDEQRQEKVRFNLNGAWPVKFMAPDLKAAANEVAVNSLELAHEGLRIG
jgi:phage tail-like protein